MWNYSCLIWVLLFVDGASGDETNEVKVTAGDPVTLTGFPEVKRDNQILWKFNNSIIVKVEEAASIDFMSSDEKFRHRLKLNKQNASLTIIKTESIHAGIYQLEISGNEDNKLKRFSVTVSDVESKSKIEGDSFSLSIDVKVQQGDHIEWKSEDQVIPTDHLNGPWSNIRVNKETGELSFTQIRINQTGNYEVKINTRSLILHRKFNITVAPSPSTTPSGAASGICGAGVGLIVWAVAVFLLQEV